jgi:hypothetical protein
MMTREQIEHMLDGTEIEYRYHHFETEEAVNPPFICWLIPGTENFSADGIVYLNINELNIELYTDQKDFDLERRVEKQLDDNGIFWDKSEVYIESENMYEVLYEMEV